MELAAYYIENELLIGSLILAGSLILLRFGVLLVSMATIGLRRERLSNFFKITPRLLIPYHRLLIYNPVKVFVRIIFHLGLILIPLGIYQHVEMWQDAGFDWELLVLSEAVVPWLTFSVLLALLYFIARRLIFSRLRAVSGIKDYLLLAMAGLPFLTGYLLSHGHLNFIHWFENNLYTLHVLSGEIFIVTLGILTCQTTVRNTLCTACAACTLTCPTNALTVVDSSKNREIQYGPGQCIVCGNCEGICPEHAARLKHDFKLPNPFALKHRRVLKLAPLITCPQCGIAFVPEGQFLKLRRSNQDECLTICPDCRQQNQAENLYCQFFDNAGETFDHELKRSKQMGDQVKEMKSNV